MKEAAVENPVMLLVFPPFGLVGSVMSSENVSPKILLSISKKSRHFRKRWTVQGLKSA